MNLPRPYEIVAPLTVYEVLGSMPRASRRRVEDFLQRLTRQPLLPGDFEAPAEAGRIHQAKAVGDWLVSYWPDHSVREIRLSGIEQIE
ncbi:MAG: hypothetical protein JNL39_18590 [Opitutaceae bacterium]|nr:hypothetical protein [Opitutaceae bacterium]